MAPSPSAEPTRPDTGPATVEAVDSAPGGARKLWLGPGWPVRHRPGQVAVLSAAGESGFFAIASGPAEAEELLFLVKVDDASVFGGLAVGDRVELTAPLGGGFELGDARGADLLLVGAGTAVAPLRSVVLHVLARRAEFGRVTLVHGAREPDAFAFVDEHEGWRRGGIDVRLVASTRRPAARWSGRRGWVQDHLGDLATPRTVALVAGMPEMELAVGLELERLGIPPAQIRGNYDPGPFNR